MHQELLAGVVTLFAVLPWTASAAPPRTGAFPWEGTVRLATDKGQVLEWTVAHTADQVVTTGSSPNWKVEHHARPDGTPLSTVRQNANGNTTRIIFTPLGASYEFTRKDGTKKTTEVSTRGLWDGDSLDVRLAGITWANGKTVKFNAFDTDSEGGDVYPMVAEYIGLESCAGVPCHHVRVSLGDFRRYFAPSWDFRYGTGPGSPYLQYDGDKVTFTAALAAAKK